MYSAVLAIINRKSPILSKMIHENHNYNPFSLELPNIINVIGIELEPIFRDLPGIEILKEKTYGDLLNDNYSSQSIFLELKNTTFRFQALDTPIPVPEKILSSLKERWNQLYPEKITLEVPFEGERTKNATIVTYANIITTKHKIGNYHPFTVFNGKIRLKAVGSKDYIHQFNVLMRFAEFAGIGHKRTMGMGVTKIL